MAERVGVDNFRAAETARMFDRFVAQAGGVNRWFHFRAPTPVDQQPVIRMNRDTLYSVAVVDITAGARLTVPEPAGRYLSVMAVNAEHYINRVYRGPGTYELTVAEHGTDYVALAARAFVDPVDASDVAAVNALQDEYLVEAVSSRPFLHPDYDEDSLTAVRDALLALGAAGVPNTDRTFGAKSDVDPVRHLIGTAMGWGGLPESQAYYYIEASPQPVGQFTMTFKDVPVDAFWSVSVYNRDGFFEPNPYDSYNLNSVTAEAEPDGSVVLNLAPEPNGLKNHLYVMDGWNYALRLYQPRPEVPNKSWSPPVPQLAGS